MKGTSMLTPDRFGEFEGTVQAEWLADGREMRLLADFAFLASDGERWLSPSGSVVNGASIPRVLWTAVGSPFTGHYRDASVIHDVACDTRERSWQDTHRMFYAACRCGGVGELKAKVMFAAVYHFGPRWGPAGEAVQVAESAEAFDSLRAFVESTNPSLDDIESTDPSRLSRRDSARVSTESATPPRSPTDYLRHIGARQVVTALESLEQPVESAGKVAEALQSEDFRAEQLRRLQRAFIAADRGGPPPNAATKALRKSALLQADMALRAFALNREHADLGGAEFGLEALVQLNGRPAVPVKNGELDVDLTDPDLGDWQGAIALGKKLIAKTSESVGRIDVDGRHVGTGFVVAPGLVMTNRHVLQDIAHEATGNGKGWQFVIGTPTIDFARELGSSITRMFEITGVEFVGPDRIPMLSDIGRLDMALLRVQTTNEAGQPFPPPLTLSKSPAVAAKKSEIFTVGYPGRPSRLPLRGDGRDKALLDALERIFRFQFGVKRVAFGLVSHGAGMLPSDRKKWAIGHDATTLGGNSGSCVSALNDGNRVVGLHFGGSFFEYNMAHLLPAVGELRAGTAATLGMVWQ